MARLVARTLMVIGATAVLAAGPAHAANVHWSVGIQAPIAPGVSVGTVISSQHGFPVVVPVVAPPPVYWPAPVVYAPPIYAAPPVYAPPIYARPIYAPRVVYGAPVWVGGRWVRGPVHHHHPHPGGWRHGFDHRPAPVPVRRPGREVRY